MMAEEHQLQPVSRRHALRSAIIVGVAAIIGSIIPLVPFLFSPVTTAMILAIVLSAVVLFVVGAIKARMTIGHPGKSGLEMAVIGTVSALVGYAVGMFLKVPATP
jgi:predicted membrane protein (TIGR00267 family)